MFFSPHSLHGQIIKSSEHRAAVAARFAAMALAQPSALPSVAVRVAPGSIQIPLTTVSLDSNFDAYLGVSFKGAATKPVQLVVDSGNSVLVVPKWEDIQAIPNWQSNYQILGSGNEPFGCPANVVRGPIEIATLDGTGYKINDCVFYACTGSPPGCGDRTANFGAGCLSPWTASGWNTPVDLGLTIQAPLSYNTDYPYVEFCYAPAATVNGPAAVPTVMPGSQLIVSKTCPAAYTLFDILPDKTWMALTPKVLTIGTTKTGWPGDVLEPLAVIDTGGGPVFLSDPNGCVCNTVWPDPVDSPDWAWGSSKLQSIDDSISIELGDKTGSFSYQIDTSTWPESVRGLTLVMCKISSYMQGENGMNIGGISALTNFIMVNYQGRRVGFKSK